eukprot:s610_g7.t1
MPRSGRARKEATSRLTEVLAANADIHWEAGAQLLDAAKTPGHRFYSDGTHLSEQGMVEFERDYTGKVAGSMLLPLPVAPAWGSSFVGGGFKKHLLGWPLPQCRSVKPAAFSTVTKVPAKDTLWVEHASDAGNDVGADVPIQSLDAAIADFREASFSSGPYSSMLMILCQACDGWKYRLILVDLVPASNIPVDRVWVQLDLTSKARPLQASRSRDGLTELRIVQADDLEAYKAAMEKEGGDLISRLTTQRYEFGWTALHFIAGNNAVRILDWILGEVPGTVSGGDDKDLRNAYMKLLTTKSSDSEIPLHLAAQEGHEKLLSVLDDKFPDQIGRIQCGNKNDDGSTPLLVAVEHVGGKSSDRVEKVLELLIVKGGSNAPSLTSRRRSPRRWHGAFGKASVTALALVALAGWHSVVGTLFAAPNSQKVVGEVDKVEAELARVRAAPDPELEFGRKFYAQGQAAGWDGLDCSKGF